MQAIQELKKSEHPGERLMQSIRQGIKDRPIFTGVYSAEWNGLKGMIMHLMRATASGAVTPAPIDLVALWENDYSKAVEYYSQWFEPVLIRWAGVVVAFDANNLPEIVRAALNNIKNGRIPAEPEILRKFNNQFPVYLNKIYTSRYVLPVYIKNELFIIDITSWDGNNINVDHLKSLSLFSDFKGWN